MPAMHDIMTVNNANSIILFPLAYARNKSVTSVHLCFVVHLEVYAHLYEYAVPLIWNCQLDAVVYCIKYPVKHSVVIHNQSSCIVTLLPAACIAA